jgi:hypothetical protein
MMHVSTNDDDARVGMLREPGYCTVTFFFKRNQRRQHPLRERFVVVLVLVLVCFCFSFGTSTYAVQYGTSLST